jgi:hypothetical protein
MTNIDELIATLAEDPVAVKPAPHPYTLSLKWIVIATVYLLVSTVFSGTRPDLMNKLHQPLFVAEIIALSGIFIATTLSAALLSFPDLHQMRRLAFTPLITFALLLIVMCLAWLSDQPGSPLPVHSIECTLSITLFSLLPAIWTFFEMRKFASTHYHLAGSIALLSAFSVGALWLRLHEATDSIVHIIEWHYLPMLGIGWLGWLLGGRLLKW